MGGHKKIYPVTCEGCGIVFLVEKYRLKTAHYHSSECMYGSEEWKLKTGEANSYKVRSEEHKAKISKRMTELRADPNSVYNSPEYRDKMSKSTKGKVFSEEHKRKIGVESAKRVGELSSMWEGGKSFGLYTPFFRRDLKEEVRAIFGDKCFLCGKVHGDDDRELNVHHVDYDKENVFCMNLVPLCDSCHSQTNHHRSFWTWFFGEKLIGERHTLVNIGKGE